MARMRSKTAKDELPTMGPLRGDSPQTGPLASATFRHPGLGQVGWEAPLCPQAVPSVPGQAAWGQGSPAAMTKLAAALSTLVLPLQTDMRVQLCWRVSPLECWLLRASQTPGSHGPPLPGDRRCSSPDNPLDATAAVGGQQLPPPRVYELLGVGQQGLAGREEASAEPQQLPAPLLAVPGEAVPVSLGRALGDALASQAPPEAPGKELAAGCPVAQSLAHPADGERALPCPFCQRGTEVS